MHEFDIYLYNPDLSLFMSSSRKLREKDDCTHRRIARDKLNEFFWYVGFVVVAPSWEPASVFHWDQENLHEIGSVCVITARYGKASIKEMVSCLPKVKDLLRASSTRHAW